jgi:solute carrier family 25 (mitochondrial folate transporter), member 32
MLSTGSSVPGAYPSLLSGARQIIDTEGLLGFYRGLLPALFGVSHGAFQFMAYEKLKAYRSRRKKTQQVWSMSDSQETSTGDLNNGDLLVISTLSKTFAGSITYPYQVLRTRLQAYDAAQAYRGIGDVILQILQQEGLRGFYKGIIPNIARVLPSTWITFLVYENIKTFFPLLASMYAAK